MYTIWMCSHYFLTSGIRSFITHSSDHIPISSVSLLRFCYPKRPWVLPRQARVLAHKPTHPNFTWPLELFFFLSEAICWKSFSYSWIYLLMICTLYNFSFTQGVTFGYKQQFSTQVAIWKVRGNTFDNCYTVENWHNVLFQFYQFKR